MIEENWPELPLDAWRPTCDTLHMLAQIAGKVRLALSPPEPEWAHTALYVVPRGLTTGPIPYGDRSFAIDFDFIGHAIEFAASDGERRSIALVPKPVAEYYREMRRVLRDLHLDVRIWPMPVEVPNPIRFDADTVHVAYDPEYAGRFHRALVAIDNVFNEHRAPFRRRHTLVQFFFGTFDVAYARFSGRPATSPSDEVIMRGAMDAEEICAGFWPGDDRFPEPAFWCYAFPKPPGAEGLAVEPNAATWNDAMGEFVIRYDDIRRSASPREALRAFLRSTFDGLSRLANWEAAPAGRLE